MNCWIFCFEGTYIRTSIGELTVYKPSRHFLFYCVNSIKINKINNKYGELINNKEIYQLSRHFYYQLKINKINNNYGELINNKEIKIES